MIIKQKILAIIKPYKFFYGYIKHYFYSKNQLKISMGFYKIMNFARHFVNYMRILIFIKISKVQICSAQNLRFSCSLYFEKVLIC